MPTTLSPSPKPDPPPPRTKMVHGNKIVFAYTPCDSTTNSHTAATDTSGHPDHRPPTL